MAAGALMMSYENLDYATGTTACGLGSLARSTSLRNSLKRQREPLWIHNTRLQLQEQIKCLDIRLENHVAMLAEIQDFYKKRAEVELEYSKNMDKLVRQIVSRHKADKRETWPGYSTYSIWQTLLSTTKKLGKDHGVLSELYSNQMVFRVNELAEDTQRIFKKCREMTTSHHNEIIRSLTELQSSMKTYHLYYGESLHAEGKLRHVESQKTKVESNSSSKVLMTRRLRNIEKQSEKRQLKYVESRLRAVKARNEYLLCLEAANASLQKYYSDDLHDLISAMDYGYHSTLGRAVMMHISGEDNMLQSRHGCLDLLTKRIRDLNQKSDKQTFLDAFIQSFQTPKPFEFQAHKGDEINQISGQKSVQEDLIDRLRSIAERLNALKVENDEIWKTLETTDSRLMEMVTQKDYDVTPCFQDDSPQPPKSPLEKEKQRSDQLETEEFYLNKYHAYQTTNNLVARLQAKYNCIEKALTEHHCLTLANMGPPYSSVSLPRIPAIPPKPKRRKQLGKASPVDRPQLFGGSIMEYVQASGEDIPLIVKSCIRIMNLYGMHHQGVFRVSGSQIEINDFKSQFERGMDLSPDQVDGKDINSVAGVLKLYFRELKEPLFPFSIFHDLINFISNNSFTNPEELPESISRLQHLLVGSLSRPVIVLMRFLFAFLNHLSEFSDENMMDPYNLAICFGPTLMPVPEDLDQVVFQSHVNELIKNVIIYQDEIFPHDGGTMYERCEVQVEGRPVVISDNLSDDEEVLEELASEDDPNLKKKPPKFKAYKYLDVTEAIALFDFQGRTDRELSFKKGDVLVVYEKVSADWWEGAVGDREGLLPDKYISVQIKNKYGTFKSREEEKFKSTESLPLKSFTLSVVGFDDLSPMSASHPNLELNNPLNNLCHSNNNSQLDEDMSTLKILSAYKPEDKGEGEMSPNGGENKLSSLNSSSSDRRSPNVKQHETKHFKKQQPGRTTEDLSSDIDFALAEVMSGIHSLGMRHGVELNAGGFKHTPDLVIGLPQASNAANPSSPKTNLIDDSNVLTTAEVFANADQCTIKKGQGISAHKVEKHFVKTDDSILRNSNFAEKKYATLGRIDAKKSKESYSGFRQTYGGERNTFGKPKQCMPGTLRQHSMISPIQPPVVPPVRTSSCAGTKRSSEMSATLRPSVAGTLDSRFFKSTNSPLNIQPVLPERRISSPDSIQSNESYEHPSSRQSAASSNSSIFLPEHSSFSNRNSDNLFSNKPAIKAKPPLMKKPTRINEGSRKSSDSQNSDNVSSSSKNS